MEPDVWTTPARLRAMPSWVINQAALAANRRTDRALAEAGLRRHHFSMLAALDEFGPASQAELGRCTGIDRSDVAAAINLLAEQGLVQRSPDPADGRRNIITLTATGKHRLEELHAILLEAQSELMSGLTRNEAATVIRSLSKLFNVR